MEDNNTSSAISSSSSSSIAVAGGNTDDATTADSNNNGDDDQDKRSRPINHHEDADDENDTVGSPSRSKAQEKRGQDDSPPIVTTTTNMRESQSEDLTNGGNGHDGEVSNNNNNSYSGSGSGSSSSNNNKQQQLQDDSSKKDSSVNKMSSSSRKSHGNESSGRLSSSYSSYYDSSSSGSEYSEDESVDFETLVNQNRLSLAKSSNQTAAAAAAAAATTIVPESPASSSSQISSTNQQQQHNYSNQLLSAKPGHIDIGDSRGSSFVGGRGSGSGRGLGGNGSGRAVARIPRSLRMRNNNDNNNNNNNTLLDDSGKKVGLEMRRNRSLDLVDSVSASSGSTGGRRGLMTRASTERFAYKAAADDFGEENKNAVDIAHSLPVKSFKMKARSLSMDLGTKIKEEEAKNNINIIHRQFSGQGRRYSVKFGASREQSHYQPRVIRRSRKMDIQTGGETYREVICQRIIDYAHAMNPAERRRKLVMRTGNDENERRSMHGISVVPQYRLQCKMHSNAFKEQIGSDSVQPGYLTSYLIWSLRSNFVIVLMSEAAAFWAMICIFATCVYLGAVYQPQCLEMPYGDFEEGGFYFLDAFAISWTTFSTVGYGIIRPKIQRGDDEKSYQCAFMTTLLSLEAFVGVIFASFCGAVIVGKVSRAKSTASVRFSHRMILRYGNGIMYTNDDDDRCNDDEEKSVSDQEKNFPKYPCPVLEFRLANLLYGNPNSEILNSKISVVGSTLADKESDSGGKSFKRLSLLKDMKESASYFIRSQLQQRPLGDDSSADDIIGTGMRRSASADDVVKNGKDPDKKDRVFRRVSRISHEAIESVIKKKRIMRRPPGRSLSSDQRVDQQVDQRVDPMSESAKRRERRHAICVDEDPTGGLIPRKFFSTLKTECDTHPFFKRVWTVRHVLDADSPLVSAKASHMIKHAGGLWPAEACNYKFIRENVNFQQLIVSLSGTTGVNGCNVYGIHVYDYPNLHVGYAFAPILETTVDGRLEVDLDRLDNIRVQRGGGAEPLDYYEYLTRPNALEERHADEKEEKAKPPRAQFKRPQEKTPPLSTLRQMSSHRSSTADGDYQVEVKDPGDVDDDDDLVVRRVSYYSVLRTSTK